MNDFYNLIKKEFNSYYQDSIYSEPLVVDLERDYPYYSLSRKMPAASESIQAMMERELPGFGKLSNVLIRPSFSTFAKANLSHHVHVFNLEDPKNLIFEHPQTPEWLIKQNFTFGSLPHIGYGMLGRYVFADRVPLWLFSVKNWLRLAFANIRGIKLKNGDLNALRVVVLKKARRCIKKHQLDRVMAVKEYLHRFPNALPAEPLNNRFYVVSKKVPLLSNHESIRRLVRLARENPGELREILRQMCIVIKEARLTDIHIENICFTNDGTDRICFFDGEPIGGVQDISQSEVFTDFDAALPPLLGLIFFAQSTSRVLSERFDLPDEDIRVLSSLINDVIDPFVRTILQERKVYYFKILLSILCPLIPFCLLLKATSNAALRIIQRNNG